MTDNLKKVIIKREKDGWSIIREREDNSESAFVGTLEEAFNFVRALYDENGEEKCE